MATAPKDPINCAVLKYLAESVPVLRDDLIKVESWLCWKPELHEFIFSLLHGAVWGRMNMDLDR